MYIEGKWETLITKHCKDHLKLINEYRKVCPDEWELDIWLEFCFYTLIFNLLDVFKVNLNWTILYEMTKFKRSKDGKTTD